VQATVRRILYRLRRDREFGFKHHLPYHECEGNNDKEDDAYRDLSDIRTSLRTGRLESPWDVPYDEDHLVEGVGEPFSLNDVLNIRMIKWLLRYDRKHLAYLAPDIFAIIELRDYQRSRLCAVAQVLSAWGVQRDVFAAHCGGLDIAGYSAANLSALAGGADGYGDDGLL